MGFFEDFEKLKSRFPEECQTSLSVENCDWGNNIFNSVNCYYVFDSSQMRECIHCHDSFKETNCVDSLWNTTCEQCLEVSDSGECNNCYFCQYLIRCYNMWYSFRCADCHDCFGCADLSNKEYCIFNVQHTQEEFESKLPELKKIPQEEIFEKVKELDAKFPYPNSNYHGNENSDYVDYVFNSKGCYYCFDCSRMADCFYANNSNECKDVYDTTFAFQDQQSASLTDTKQCYNSYEVMRSARCIDSFFLFDCDDCHDCFGCVKLSHKQFCVLNVQYTEEEYRQKVAELKKELGIYFQEVSTPA